MKDRRHKEKRAVGAKLLYTQTCRSNSLSRSGFGLSSFASLQILLDLVLLTCSSSQHWDSSLQLRVTTKKKFRITTPPASFICFFCNAKLASIQVLAALMLILVGVLAINAAAAVSCLYCVQCNGYNGYLLPFQVVA